LGSRRFEEEYSSISLGSPPPYRSTVVGYGVLPATVWPGSLEAFTYQAANIATVLLRGTVTLEAVKIGCHGGRMSWREDVLIWVEGMLYLEITSLLFWVKFEMGTAKPF
jgi:hypothetical protein